MKLKHWIQYRYEEIEEKANVTQLPTHDMDGSRYVVDEDFEPKEWDDFYQSVSKRLDDISMSCMYYEDETGLDDRF